MWFTEYIKREIERGGEMDKYIGCPECKGFVFTGNFFGRCKRCKGMGRVKIKWKISKTETPMNKGQNAIP